MKLKSIALTAIIATIGTRAQAQATIDTYSSYVSRGMVFGPGPVAQPSLTISQGPFTSMAWLNKDPHRGFNEIDLNLRFAHEFGEVKVEASYGYDAFRFSSSKATQEADLSVASGRLTGLFVHDFGSGKGQYLELAYADSATRKSPVAFRFALGYNNHYFKQTSSFSHLEAKASLPLHALGFTITPNILGLKALSKSFTDEFVYGVSLMKTF